MSTYCLKSASRKGVGFFVLSLVVVMLIAQQLVAPAVTFASAAGCPPPKMGLGVLVGSWETVRGSKDFSNWVLTDGSLIDPNGISCGVGKPIKAFVTPTTSAGPGKTPAASTPSSSATRL